MTQENRQRRSRPPKSVSLYSYMTPGIIRNDQKFASCHASEAVFLVVSVGLRRRSSIESHVEHIDRTIGSGILGRDETVQRVIRERLTAGGVFVVRDGEDVAVICARSAVAYVEVIANGEHRLARRVS